MARKGQHDQSPGDGRKPFSDRGGPEGKHAETHDVRREELTNPKGPQSRDESFDADIAPDTSTAELRTHVDESTPAVEDKSLHGQLDMLEGDELARLTVLQAGAKLEQGSVYLDLGDLERGPFKAIGGQEVGPSDRYVAKKETDYELWNRLVGQDREAELERPSGVS